MLKRVIVVPIFNDGTFLPYLIDNYVEVFKPTHIIFNEGLFPSGPENSSRLTEFFYKKFTVDRVRSFDIEYIQRICLEKQAQHGIEIVLNKMDYPAGIHTEEAYRIAYTYGLPSLKPEDLIFPLEADAFFKESDAYIINKEIDKLNFNEGFKVLYLRFFEAPFIRIDAGQHRKVCIKYGDGSLYDKFSKIMFWESGYENVATVLEYASLFKFVDSFVGFHYEFLKENLYMDAKMSLLYRSDSFAPYKMALDYIRTNKKFSKECTTVDYFVHYDGDHPKIMYDYPKFKEYV